MAFFELRPFQVGKTYYDASQTPTAAGTAGDAASAYLGLEVYVEDIDPTQALRRSNRVRKLRVVRNTCASGSGGTTTGLLLPKRLVKFDNGDVSSTGFFYGTACDGYASLLATGLNVNGQQKGYPVDEYVVSTGVRINDLFYIVIEGPAVCLMPLAQIADVNVGEPLMCTTGTTTGSTTSGRAMAFATYNLATTVLAQSLLAIIGRAMSAVSSSSTTNTGILVDIGRGL